MPEQDTFDDDIRFRCHTEHRELAATGRRARGCDSLAAYLRELIEEDAADLEIVVKRDGRIENNDAADADSA